MSEQIKTCPLCKGTKHQPEPRTETLAGKTEQTTRCPKCWGRGYIRAYVT